MDHQAMRLSEHEDSFDDDLDPLKFQLPFRVNAKSRYTTIANQQQSGSPRSLSGRLIMSTLDEHL